MDPLTQRVATRWLGAGLRVINRNGEYPTKLLRDMTVAIAKRMSATGLSLVIRFGTRAPTPGGKGSIGQHTVEKGGKHILYVNKNWALETQVKTIAHEMQHALQGDSGRLSGGFETWLWEGETYPTKIPHGQRPWEREAIQAESHGQAVFQDFKSKGLIPKTRSEQGLDQMEAEGKIPARGKLIHEMTEEEILQWKRERRKLLS